MDQSFTSSIETDLWIILSVFFSTKSGLEIECWQNSNILYWIKSCVENASFSNCMPNVFTRLNCFSQFWGWEQKIQKAQTLWENAGMTMLWHDNCSVELLHLFIHCIFAQVVLGHSYIETGCNKLHWKHRGRVSISDTVNWLPTFSKTCHFWFWSRLLNEVLALSFPLQLPSGGGLAL